MLKALDKQEKNVDYYALDLDYSELERTLAAIPPGTYKHVRCHGLHGTYDDGLAWLKTAENAQKPKCIMTLGSSVGNFPRPDASAFLKGFGDMLNPGDALLVGLDGCSDGDRVFHAYNDREGVTDQFTMNGLKHANRIMGRQVFEEALWKSMGAYSKSGVKHQAFVSPSKDVEIEGILIKAGEKVRIEESYKYTPNQAQELWQAAGLTVGAVFGDSTGTYREQPNFPTPHLISLQLKINASSCETAIILVFASCSCTAAILPAC